MTTNYAVRHDSVETIDTVASNSKQSDEKSHKRSSESIGEASRDFSEPVEMEDVSRPPESETQSALRPERARITHTEKYDTMV